MLVALLARVSQSAVSRTFTPGASVSPATREKVLAAARQLGFRPSAIPQIMLTGRSGIVAVVVGVLENAFYGRVLEVFAARLRDAGKQVLIVQADSDYALDGVAARLSQFRVDAIVSALAVLSAEVARSLSVFNIPVVSFNTPVTAPWVSAVGSDNRAAGRWAAAHLLERGGHSFGYLSGPSQSPASHERLFGFRAELKRRGATPPVVSCGDYTYVGGTAAAQTLFERDPDVDALFCATDFAAFGAIDVIRQSGRRVPQDVMVVGYDDSPAASWGAYDMTTFDQNISALVDATMTIIGSDAGEPERPRTVRIAPQVIERGRTRR